MTVKITYYAMFDEDTSRETPRAVLRRVETDKGQIDELFSRDLTWGRQRPLMAPANYLILALFSRYRGQRLG
jgi:hypothetical protein